MIRACAKRVFAGSAVFVVAQAFAGSAFADGEGALEKERHEKAPAAEGAPAGEAARGEKEPEKAEAKGEEGEEKEKTFSLGIDFVVGSARTDVVTQNVPASLVPGGVTTLDSSRIRTYSFLLGGTVELFKHFELGVRVPLQGGTIQDPSYTRGTASIGNVEVEPEVSIPLNERLELGFAFGVALPTAQGTPVPESADEVRLLGNGIDQSGYDRAAIQRAVAMARGYDENALFEPEHMGLIPKVRLRWFSPSKWHVDPWVKLENLVATTSEEKFVSELVFGVNAGYFVNKMFEPALRVWGNVPVTGADFTSVAVVEPELKLHAGDGTLLAGVILPVAGPLTSPYAIGVRIGGGVRF